MPPAIGEDKTLLTPPSHYPSHYHGHSMRSDVLADNDPLPRMLLLLLLLPPPQACGAVCPGVDGLVLLALPEHKARLQPRKPRGKAYYYSYI